MLVHPSPQQMIAKTHTHTKQDLNPTVYLVYVCVCVCGENPQLSQRYLGLAVWVAKYCESQITHTHTSY